MAREKASVKTFKSFT